MKFIKDLGVKQISPKNKKRARMYMMECPSCHGQFEQIAYQAKVNLFNECRACSRITSGKTNRARASGQHDDTRKRKSGVANSMYQGQRDSSKRRGHPMPDYTITEFRDWLYSQPNFNKLFEEWEKSGHSKDLKPSADRLDDYEPYTFKNIQLMTWQQNKDKGNKDIKNGINNKISRAVVAHSKDGVFVKEYHSSMEAHRQTGILVQNIFSVLKGITKSAGGYIWTYKEI